ncbi:hypothetical protein D9M68_140360 [compost metagenome]
MGEELHHLIRGFGAAQVADTKQVADHSAPGKIGHVAFDIVGIADQNLASTVTAGFDEGTKQRRFADAGITLNDHHAGGLSIACALHIRVECCKFGRPVEENGGLGVDGRDGLGNWRKGDHAAAHAGHGKCPGTGKSNLAGSLLRRCLVDENAACGNARQPGGHVHGGSNDSVVGTMDRPERAAETLAGRDAGRQAEIRLVEFVRQAKGGDDRPARIVGMFFAGQAENGEDFEPAGMERCVQDLSTGAADDGNRSCYELVQPIEIRIEIAPDDMHEKRGHDPEVCEPL